MALEMTLKPYICVREKQSEGWIERMGQRRAEKDEKNTKKEFPNKETTKEGQGLPLWNYLYTNRYPSYSADLHAILPWNRSSEGPLLGALGYVILWL